MQINPLSSVITDGFWWMLTNNATASPWSRLGSLITQLVSLSPHASEQDSPCFAADKSASPVQSPVLSTISFLYSQSLSPYSQSLSFPFLTRPWGIFFLVCASLAAATTAATPCSAVLPPREAFTCISFVSPGERIILAKCWLEVLLMFLKPMALGT